MRVEVGQKSQRVSLLGIPGLLPVPPLRMFQALARLRQLLGSGIPMLRPALDHKLSPGVQGVAARRIPVLVSRKPRLPGQSRGRPSPSLFDPSVILAGCLRPIHPAPGGGAIICGGDYSDGRSLSGTAGTVQGKERATRTGFDCGVTGGCQSSRGIGANQ